MELDRDLEKQKLNGDIERTLLTLTLYKAVTAKPFKVNTHQLNSRVRQYGGAAVSVEKISKVLVEMCSAHPPAHNRFSHVTEKVQASSIPMVICFISTQNLENDLVLPATFSF